MRSKSLTDRDVPKHPQCVGFRHILLPLFFFLFFSSFRGVEAGNAISKRWSKQSLECSPYLIRFNMMFCVSCSQFVGPFMTQQNAVRTFAKATSIQIGVSLETAAKTAEELQHHFASRRFTFPIIQKRSLFRKWFGSKTNSFQKFQREVQFEGEICFRSRRHLLRRR